MQELLEADQLIEKVYGTLGAIIEDTPGWEAWRGTAAHHPFSPRAVEAMSEAELARTIDSTLLKPEATVEQVERLCGEALQHQFATVCVNPDHVARCIERLQGSQVGVTTVIGFPLGATTSTLKALETFKMVELGADELDMVIHLGRLKERDWIGERGDIRGVVEAAQGRPVKVIVEAGGLSDEELVAACLLSRAAGAAYVKTSTGFLFGGATVQAVRMMRKVVGTDVGVKAAGGIRDTQGARTMLTAGATRLGASSAVAIVTGLPN